jgi:hypothetical protein
MARPILRPISCLRACRRIKSSLTGKTVPARSRAMTYLVTSSGTEVRGVVDVRRPSDGRARTARGMPGRGLSPSSTATFVTTNWRCSGASGVSTRPIASAAAISRALSGVARLVLCVRWVTAPLLTALLIKPRRAELDSSASGRTLAQDVGVSKLKTKSADADRDQRGAGAIGCTEPMCLSTSRRRDLDKAPQASA